MFDINRKGERFTSHMVSVHHGGQGKWNSSHYDGQKTEQDNRKYLPYDTLLVTLNSSSP